MTFEHYIITRFNLSFFEGVSKSNCDKEYLEYRFGLFEKYCYPSFVNQTCQNFKWLVLFDYNTPTEFKTRINKLSQNYPNLIPCFLDYNEYKSIPEVYYSLCMEYEETLNTRYPNHPYNLKEERKARLITPLFIKDSIKKCSNQTPDYYITTRIDNDDAFHKDMIATIQDIATKKTSQHIIDFVYTYKYILNEGIVYRYPLENGHFISLIEPSTQIFKSVLYWNHLFVEDFIPVDHIYQKTLQAELIHGKNVVNNFTELTCTGMIYAIFHFKPNDFGYSNIYLSAKRWIRIFAFLLKQKIRV